MPQASLRFLCTGDLHLGRYPTRIPSRQEKLTVESVWQKTVAYAISQDVDALLITGDVVDRDNRYYEAFGPLQRSVEQLVQAEIPVYAVSGNHDFDVLPRLSDGFSDENFQLLGRAGTWETVEFPLQGESRANIAGWSFPQNRVVESPLSDYVPPDNGLPTIGLVHGDLDQTESPYAPISRSELVQSGASAWLLGHIHRSALYQEAGTPILYVGSLQPLDPGEPGSHGPWILELSPNGSPSFAQVPLATLRYAHHTVDVSEISHEGEFRDLITDEVRRNLADRREKQRDLLHIVYRLRFTGRTAIQPKLERWADNLVQSGVDIPSGDTSAAIDTVSFHTLPDHDLEKLSTEPGPPSVIAKLLLSIERGDPLEDFHPLTKRIKRSMDKVKRANAFQALDRRDDNPHEVNGELNNILHRQGMKLLDQMMEQKREGGRDE